MKSEESGICRFACLTNAYMAHSVPLSAAARYTIARLDWVDDSGRLDATLEDNNRAFVGVLSRKLDMLLLDSEEMK